MRQTLLTAVLLSGALTAPSQSSPPPLQSFIDAASTDERASRRALDAIAVGWKDGYTPMFVDLMRLMRRAPGPGESPATESLFADDEAGVIAATPPRSAARPVPRESVVRTRLLRFLERQTGKRFDETLHGWRQWMWTLPYDPHPQYGEFKGLVYSRIDPRMRAFFPPGVRSRIRLDEIDWGGVRVNGIPPLVYPRVLTAAEARYLKESHIVFGLEVNGEARAYPRRILAWHELATDKVGGVELTIVYCTLCGTVIPYESTVAGRLLRFGTSGLLYRSNKLMFDEQTGSLWNSIQGTPVVGPLHDSGLSLTPLDVVTTTWGEWRAAHPRTTVLSLETGHKRDYSEGAAYRDYFAHDRLYFGVPHADARLKNKAEVLTLRIRSRATADAQPIAIDVSLLKRNPAYHFDVDARRFVVITSRRGANRVYETSGRPVAFQSTQSDGFALDAAGDRWRVTETALVLERDPAVRLPRIVAARGFWFGWYAQFPQTRLIK